jgi:hypothetical protein
MHWDDGTFHDVVASTWEGIVPIIGNVLLCRIKELSDPIGTQDLIGHIIAIVTYNVIRLPALPYHDPPSLFRARLLDRIELILMVGMALFPHHRSRL